ncbi:hypothetical protein Sjap_024535 [Stephania japonica]|uniref:AP-3 complex subunit delta n=1 Tax=Stephania japonica TaxID=461633 RepID=A0AAP0EKS2_9MAGN
MAAQSIMDSLFQHTLSDMIKSLRHHPIGESKLISKSLDEIRREIKSTDPSTKSTALEKLTYLSSIHAASDMSFASFPIVELLSSPKFPLKKTAYLAASHSFHSSTDVLLLITNQLRKDLASANEHEVCLALNLLSVIGTPDLLRDLTPDLVSLLSTNKLLVRKKAIALTFRVFENCPDSVRLLFRRLVENLESSDQGVVSATVGVFAELVGRDARSYLALAPEFYRVLVDCKNNWVLIKVLKIFAKLAPLEARLGRRIVEPICEHMRRSGAKSVVFECVRTVVSCLSDYESAVRLAVDKIREFMGESDPNLKYLGLQALSVLAGKHLWAVGENKEAVIKALSDADPNIKREALRLVMMMVSESNVADICRILVNYALKSDPDFCNGILRAILVTCCRNDYEVVEDFDWYVSLLGEMSRNPQCREGEEIERQLVDISLRVKEARPELVRVARELLIDPALLGNPFVHRILSAVAWVSGEYVEFSRNPIEIIEALLQPRANLLPPLIRAVYIQSAFKVLVFCVHSFFFPRETVRSFSLDNLASRVSGLLSEKEDPESLNLAIRDTSTDFEMDKDFDLRFHSRTAEEIAMENVGDDAYADGQSSSSVVLQNPLFTHDCVLNLLNLVKVALGPLSGSDEVEVQERAQNVLGLVGLIQQEISEISLVEMEGTVREKKSKASTIIQIMQDVFSEELVPVAMTVQERVLAPEGLVLSENLAELDAICGDIIPPESSSFYLGGNLFGDKNSVSTSNQRNEEESEEPSSESTSLLAQHRKQHGLYYLPSEKVDAGSSDYPPANDPQSTDNLIDGAQDLMMLTEQSLVTKKKPNHSKPRPVVVKLNEVGEMPVLPVKPMQELKDNSLSGAIRDVLLGNDTKPSSSQRKSSEKSSRRRMVTDLPLDSVGPSKSIENVAIASLDPASSSSRRSKHRSHGKGGHRSPEKNVGSEKEDGKKEKKKSHRHGRSKTRHRAETTLNVPAESPVIPDFLL